MPVAMDICGLDSIPLSCVEMVTSSSCLCKPGFNTSDTCLGKETHEPHFIHAVYEITLSGRFSAI